VRRTYRIGDRRIGIRSTSETFGAWLDRSLAPYRVRRRVDPELSVVVDGGKPGRGAGFHILYRGTASLVRTLELTVLGRALMGELEAELLPERDDAVYARASLVGVNGSVALVPWWAGTALEGIGRRAARAGVRLPTGGAVGVDRVTGRVGAPSPLLDVPAGAVAALARLSSQRASEQRIALRGPREVDVVFAHVEGDSLLRPASRGEAIHRLSAATVNLPRVGGDALRAWARLVSGRSCYGLGPGGSREILQAVLVGTARAHPPDSSGDLHDVGLQGAEPIPVDSAARGASPPGGASG
jgi:hypothetical protein